MRTINFICAHGVIGMYRFASSHTVQFRRAIWPLIGICAMTLALYGQVRNFGFMAIDDGDYIVQNVTVRSGINLEGVRWAFSTLNGGTSYWHPLTWLSHMADVQMFGMNAGLHHLTNVWLHVLNVILVTLLAARILNSQGMAILVGALFAWHPLHVESVAWISERKDLLSSAFFFLAILEYMRYAKQGSLLRYSSSLIAYCLGLLCKPSIVTLPCVLLLLDCLILKRISLHGAKSNDGIAFDPSRKGLLACLLEKIPFLIPTILICHLTIRAQADLGILKSLDSLSMGQRVGNAIVSYCSYLFKTAVPVNLAVYYPHPGDWPIWTVAGSAIALLGVSLVCFKMFRWSSLAVFGWLWFLGTIVPSIGIVQVASQAMADRYMYIPSFGLFILLAVVVKWCVVHMAIRWDAAIYVCTVIACIFYLACATQLSHWRTDVELFTHALQVGRENPFTLGCMGIAFLEDGQLPEAQQCFEASLRRFPRDGMTLLRLGDIQRLRGRSDLAVGYYRNSMPLLKGESFSSVSLACAWILGTSSIETVRNEREAMQILNSLPKIGWRYYDTVAACQSNIGDFDNAAKSGAVALDLAKREAKDNVQSISERLGLYSKGLPFRSD